MVFCRPQSSKGTVGCQGSGVRGVGAWEGEAPAEPMGGVFKPRKDTENTEKGIGGLEGF